jgi:hypothetical protein
LSRSRSARATFGSPYGFDALTSDPYGRAR